MQELRTQAVRDTRQRTYSGVKMADQENISLRSRLTAIRISSMKMTNWRIELRIMAMKFFLYSNSFLDAKKNYMSMLMMTYIGMIRYLFLNIKSTKLHEASPTMH